MQISGADMLVRRDQVKFTQIMNGDVMNHYNAAC